MRQASGYVIYLGRLYIMNMLCYSPRLLLPMWCVTLYVYISVALAFFFLTFSPLVFCSFIFFLPCIYALWFCGKQLHYLGISFLKRHKRSLMFVCVFVGMWGFICDWCKRENITEAWRLSEALRVYSEVNPYIRGGLTYFIEF